jgi:hypothetical protein
MNKIIGMFLAFRNFVASKLEKNRYLRAITAILWTSAMVISTFFVGAWAFLAIYITWLSSIVGFSSTNLDTAWNNTMKHMFYATIASFGILMLAAGNMGIVGLTITVFSLIALTYWVVSEFEKRVYNTENRNPSVLGINMDQINQAIEEIPLEIKENLENELKLAMAAKP